MFDYGGGPPGLTGFGAGPGFQLWQHQGHPDAFGRSDRALYTPMYSPAHAQYVRGGSEYGAQGAPGAWAPAHMTGCYEGVGAEAVWDPYGLHTARHAPDAAPASTNWRTGGYGAYPQCGPGPLSPARLVRA